MSDNVNSHAGVKFFISPVANNANMSELDFLAINDWIQVSNMGSVGDYGIDTNILSYDSTDTLVARKSKGISNAGDPEFEFARDDSDAGQQAMDVAGAPSLFDAYPFKVEKQDGATDYLRGLVSGPKTPGGRNEDFDVVMYMLALNQVVFHDPRHDPARTEGFFPYGSGHVYDHIIDQFSATSEEDMGDSGINFPENLNWSDAGFTITNVGGFGAGVNLAVDLATVNTVGFSVQFEVEVGYFTEDGVQSENAVNLFTILGPNVSISYHSPTGTHNDKLDTVGEAVKSLASHWPAAKTHANVLVAYDAVAERVTMHLDEALLYESDTMMSGNPAITGVGIAGAGGFISEFSPDYAARNVMVMDIPFTPWARNDVWYLNGDSLSVYMQTQSGLQFTGVAAPNDTDNNPPLLGYYNDGGSSWDARAEYRNSASAFLMIGEFNRKATTIDNFEFYGQSGAVVLPAHVLLGPDLIDRVGVSLGDIVGTPPGGQAAHAYGCVLTIGSNDVYAIGRDYDADPVGTDVDARVAEVVAGLVVQLDRMLTDGMQSIIATTPTHNTDYPQDEVIAEKMYAEYKRLDRHTLTGFTGEVRIADATHGYDASKRSDHIHPNEEGLQFIASRIAPYLPDFYVGV